MRTFLLILVLVTLQNMAKASSNEFAKHYDTKSVEYVELSTMNGEDMMSMSECVNAAMSDEGEDVDHFEATDSCINDVLGDIHN